jgi:hypothetical protein
VRVPFGVIRCPRHLSCSRKWLAFRTVNHARTPKFQPHRWAAYPRSSWHRQEPSTQGTAQLTLAEGSNRNPGTFLCSPEYGVD